MHFVTLDEAGDDDDTISDYSNHTTPRRASISNNHLVHDQIRLGLLPHRNHMRSYSISGSESSSRQTSTCWAFCAGSITTIAVGAIAIAIFLITLNYRGGGGGSSNIPSMVGGLAPLVVGASKINVAWSCNNSVVVNLYQLQMLPSTSLPFPPVGNGTTAGGGGAPSMHNHDDVSMEDNGLSCTTTLVGLNASVAYCFRVRGVSDSHGAGSWSSTACNTTDLASVPQAPVAPSVLDFSTNANETKDQLHVSIRTPVDQGGTPIRMMSVYVNTVHQMNISIHGGGSRGGGSGGSVDTHLLLDRKLRGQLVLLSSTACNDVGCSVLSQSMRCVVAERPHSRPIAVCSPCDVGSAGSSNGIVHSPEHVRATPTPSALSAVLTWEWNDGGTTPSGSCSEERPSGFLVQRSDFWTSRSVNNGPVVNMSVAPGGSAPYETSIDMLLPSMDYEVRMRTYVLTSDASEGGSSGSGSDSVRLSRWSAPFALKMENSGACGNSNDVRTTRSKFSTMVDDIQGCLFKCIVSGKECVVDCVSKSVGLSKECSGCWYEEGQCVEKHCLVLCTKDSKSPACLHCTNENCMPDLETCTGLPRYTFPNP